MTYYMRLSTTYLSTPSLVYEGESVLPKLEDEADVLVDAKGHPSEDSETLTPPPRLPRHALGVLADKSAGNPQYGNRSDINS